MKTLIFSILFVIFANCIAYSQPMKMHERMLTIKKIKLLEYIELDEKKADKLLILVTKYENEIRDLNEKIRKMSEDIDNQINSLSDSELKKKNDELYSSVEKIGTIQKSKLEEARKFLSEKEFAKFQIFELKFAHELRKHLFENKKKRERKR